MDAPDTLIADPKPQPVITDPQMDTNKIYEQEHERPQQISDNQPIQLAQNDVPTIPTSDTHHIVQAPDGAKVAFPKGTPADTMHQEMTKWWQPHLQRTVAAWDSVRNAASNAAQAIGLPSDMPEWQKASDEFVRDPIGTTGDVVGAIIGGLAHGANAVIPSTPENNAMISRAQAEYAQGNHLAAAVTLTPLVGDGLAKAVKQAQARDYSGSLGTAAGVVAPFLTESFKGEGELPITREKTVQPTTTSYEHTPDQTGQFGNYEHVVTTKNAEGKTVGHLAAQDTAPGEVTIRSNQIYDDAHRGQGKGTAAIRTLVNETAKNPELKTIHSDITTTGAARGAWEKLADANPDTVTKQNFNGVPRWSVDLDKVREKAANAPEFNGEERRGAARRAPMGATDLETAMKTPGARIQTPFDVTAGAMDTINRDIAQRVARPSIASTIEDTEPMVRRNPNGNSFNVTVGDKGKLQIDHNGSTATVKAVDVDESAQRQGIATQMYEKAKEQLQNLGITTLKGSLEGSGPVQIREKVFGPGNTKYFHGGEEISAEQAIKVMDKDFGYVRAETTLKPDADAAALKKALSGSAGENALYAKAKVELGPEATPSEVEQRAQEMKNGTPVPKTSAAAAGRSVGAASINDLNTKPDVPTFYSKAEQVINDKVSNNSSGDSIKALLKNNGVKDDEMKWSGLDEFLKDKPKVSKAELQQFIKENQISLQDVDLGQPAPTPEMEKELHDQVLRNADLYKLGYDRTPAQESEYQQGVARANELEQQFGRKPTKYDKWTVPGERENYREKLITLPTAAEEVTPERKAYNDYHDALMRKYGVDPRDFNPNTNARPEGYQARIDAAQAKLLPEEMTRGRELRTAALNADDRAAAKSGGYVAPHFQGGGPEGNVPNIVAHVRFDDRPAVDGKKTLFMEEAQSDWHSAGRHEGYKADPKAIAEAESNLKEAKARKTEFVQSVVDRINAAQEHKLAINPLSEQTSWQIRNAMTPEESDKFNALNESVNKAAVAKTELTQGAVPDAPFKQSWHELVMKRMLRQAAENGYDRLAWTTGDQQAGLYDLSKHIGRIEYDPEQGELRAFDPQGKKVIEENVDPNVKELTPYIGAEHAENLVGQIEDYKDNAPGEPDPDWFYDDARENYDIDEREVPDENYEFEPTDEREAFDEHVKEMARKYGLDPKRTLWNDLTDKLTTEEQEEGDDLLKNAEQSEKHQEENRPTYTQYFVTDQNGDELSGPHDRQREAERDMQDRIDHDVQYQMDNYEAEKPDLPEISGLDLKHGGEFHRLLYDKMIPSFLKKYAKKWGAEVGTTEIKGMGEPEVDYEGPAKTVQELEDIKNNGGIDGKEVLGYSPMQRLKSVIADMKRGLPFRDAMLGVEEDTDSHNFADYLGGKFIKTPANQKVHSIEITPAMRQSVMKEGQPIAKKDDKKKKPFAAPQEPQVASNLRPSLAERMKNALS